MSKEMRSATKDVANMKSANDVSAIREDLSALKEDAANLVRHTKESAQEQIALAEEKGKRALKNAKATSKDYFADAETYVQQNPGQSMMAAFLGGILVSMLFRGRN